MGVGERRRLAPAWRALDEALLDEEGLVDLLQSRGFFSDHHRERVETDRTATILADQRLEQPAIHVVEAALVDLQEAQRLARHGERDPAVGLDQREVADPT